MSDPRPKLLAMRERGYGLPECRDHASLMLQIADRRLADRARCAPVSPSRARRSCDAARDLGLCLFIAAVFLWMGWVLGGGQ